MNNTRRVNIATSFLPGASLDNKRLELIALSKKLREERTQLIEASDLLKQESEELSKESRLLRNNGHRLQSVLDARKTLVEATLVEATT